VEVALDSNAFDPGTAYERKDANFFVHVNLMARDKEKCLKDAFIFAEIEGDHEPKRVTNCVLLDGISGKTVKICFTSCEVVML